MSPNDTNWDFNFEISSYRFGLQSHLVNQNKFIHEKSLFGLISSDYRI